MKIIYECPKCGKKWYYEIDRCIFCGNIVKELSPKKFLVKGITEVFVPSTEHDIAPYYELLLEDDFGNYHIQKTFESHKIGDIIDKSTLNDFALNQKLIGIMGTGIMGKQLSQFFLEAGYSVILYSRTNEGCENAVNSIKERLSKSKNPEEVAETMDRIKPTNNLSKLGEAELVIENIIEDINIKKSAFKILSKICSPNAIITTNTSSIPITELASCVSNPERFIGMHFFNPVRKMSLVEIVYSPMTSNVTIEYVMNLSKNLGKVPILVKDSPGFIVNRVLMPFINEAASLTQEGYSAKTIDNAMKLGLNHPMGPLTLADLIGLDVCLAILMTLYERFGDERYRPSQLFYDLVEKGSLGKKTGKGFYDYK